MAQARTRSVGPEVSQEAARRIALLRGDITYPDLHDMILEVTKDDQFGPQAISPATLRGMEKVTTRNGEARIRRLEAGELRAIALTFDVSTDWILALTDRKYKVWGG